MYRGYIMVCSGPNCGCTSERIAEEFEVQIKIAGLRQEIQVIRGSCMGICAVGPNVIVFPEGTIYSHVQIQDVARIVNEHLLKGNRVEELLYDENACTGTVRGLEETEFFQRQTRVALRNCGVIDPQNIEEYIAVDGYAALYKVLTEMSPDDVINTVLDSGLRGRGGAGFPTGMKWKFASGNRGKVQKYVCCNADEGDPGAFMDRSRPTRNLMISGITLNSPIYRTSCNTPTLGASPPKSVAINAMSDTPAGIEPNRLVEISSLHTLCMRNAQK